MSNLRALTIEPRIALWLVDLDGDGEDGTCDGAVLPGLSVAEQQRAARFAFDRDRRRFGRAHRSLRGLLAQSTGLACDRLQYEFGPHGKPALAERPDCRFNLSDSDGVALIGIAQGSEEIGVDVERLRPVPEAMALAESHFTTAERIELQAASEAGRDLAFLRGWTRKEACLKAIGSGLSLDARCVDAGLLPERRRLWIASVDGPVQVEVESFAIGGDLVAAWARVMR